MLTGLFMMWERMRWFVPREISLLDLQAPSNSEPPSIFRTSLAESDCFSAPKQESEPEPQPPLREDVIFSCDKKK